LIWTFLLIIIGFFLTLLLHFIRLLFLDFLFWECLW
jgi:hypothetical protein